MSSAARSSLAHVRGGAERGYGWYEQTLKAGKPRTVTDFVACAAHLAQARYPKRGRIVGHSYSAGGILIGGAIIFVPACSAARSPKCRSSTC